MTTSYPYTFALWGYWPLEGTLRPLHPCQACRCSLRHKSEAQARHANLIKLYCPPMMENQTDKNMEHEMENGGSWDLRNLTQVTRFYVVHNGSPPSSNPEP